MKPHRGTLLLVLGILGILCCGFFTGIPAWIMAVSDLKEMDAGTMDPSGRGTTQTGKILGIIGTILGVVSLILGVILGVTGALAGSFRPH